MGGTDKGARSALPRFFDKWAWRMFSLSLDLENVGNCGNPHLFAGSCSQLVDPVAPVGGPGSRFKGKHSLDSDEEDDEDEGSSKYDILASEDVEGEQGSADCHQKGSLQVPAGAGVCLPLA